MKIWKAYFIAYFISCDIYLYIAGEKMQNILYVFIQLFVYVDIL